MSILSSQSMHKGSGLISIKIGKPEVQSNFEHCANFAHALNLRPALTHWAKIRSCTIFSACAKLPASNFRPKTTPFCIFSNFTPDVITIDMGILVFHFFVRLYIAILCTVEKTFCQ